VLREFAAGEQIDRINAFDGRPASVDAGFFAPGGRIQ
jgi:hypothetical protein